MPGLSIRELLLAALILVLVLKPEQWPAFLRRAGRVYGAVSGWLQRMRDQSRQTLDELERPAKADQSPDSESG